MIRLFDEETKTKICEDYKNMTRQELADRRRQNIRNGTRYETGSERWRMLVLHGSFIERIFVTERIGETNGIKLYYEW